MSFSSLSEELFNGLSNLIHLSITLIFSSIISNHLFSSLKSIGIQSLSSGLFDDVTLLKHLFVLFQTWIICSIHFSCCDLDHNSLVYFPSTVFSNLKDLEELFKQCSCCFWIQVEFFLVTQQQWNHTPSSRFFLKQQKHALTSCPLECEIFSLVFTGSVFQPFDFHSIWYICWSHFSETIDCLFFLFFIWQCLFDFFPGI